MKIFSVIAFILLILVCAVAGEAACRFRSTPTAMNFGSLSPANTVDATATSSVTIRCTPPPRTNPVLYTVSDNSGLYSIAPGQPRMRNATNTAEYLPYSLTYANSGTAQLRRNVVITFTGTVRAVDYQNAWVGAYSDTITITINP